MSVNSKMKAIADAIRNLLDISGTMGLDAMANNISSITKRGAVAGTISAKSEQYMIPAGYHNGSGTVEISPDEQSKIIAENIKNGVTILGVAGSASGEIYSVIAVTYPEGSVCTCSNGTKTLKARDTSGKALFNVTVGEWTVTATDGNKTKSVTVSITAEGQCESVTLSYDLLLYKSGNEYKDITGGWYIGGKYGSPTLTKNRDNMKITIPEGADIAVATKSTIDFSGYSTLKIKFSQLKYKPNGYQYWGTTGNVTGFTRNTYSAVVNLDAAVNNIVSCNISTINTKQFAKLVISGLNDGGGTITTIIDAIWAE